MCDDVINKKLIDFLFKVSEVLKSIINVVTRRGAFASPKHVSKFSNISLCNIVKRWPDTVCAFTQRKDCRVGVN